MDVWSAIVSAIAGSAITALGGIWVFSSRLGENWFKSRLDKALEAFKSEQAGKLEHLREEIGHRGERGKRSIDLEFAAIQDVWEKVNEAVSSTGSCVGGYMEHPDLSKLSDEDLQAFLGTTDFSTGQIEQITDASDRNDMFQKVIWFRSIAEAGVKVAAARTALKAKRVFMPEEVRLEFAAVIDLSHGAQVERRLQFQHPNIPKSDWGGAVLKFVKENDAAIDRLAAIVSRRLFRNDTHVSAN